jgi:hypothetical protein
MAGRRSPRIPRQCLARFLHHESHSRSRCNAPHTARIGPQRKEECPGERALSDQATNRCGIGSGVGSSENVRTLANNAIQASKRLRNGGVAYAGPASARFGVGARALIVVSLPRASPLLPLGSRQRAGTQTSQPDRTETPPPLNRVSLNHAEGAASVKDPIRHVSFGARRDAVGAVIVA